jgi:hypothetical protein
VATEEERAVICIQGAQFKKSNISTKIQTFKRERRVKGDIIIRAVEKSADLYLIGQLRRLQLPTFQPPNFITLELTTPKVPKFL